MAVILALLAAGCARPGEVHGFLVDGLGGPLPAGVGIVAVASGPVPPACERIVGTVDDGYFGITGLCPGSTYRLEPDQAEWLAPDAPLIDGGGAGPELSVQIFHVPVEDGVAISVGGGLVRLQSQAGLDTILPIGGAASLRIPTALPSTPPAVGEGWLVLAGARVIDSVAFHTLAPTPAITVGSSAVPLALGPWFALGPQVEPAHARDVTMGDRRVRFLPKDALPAGDYILAERGGSRGILVRFGASP